MIHTKGVIITKSFFLYRFFLFVLMSIPILLLGLRLKGAVL